MLKGFVSLQKKETITVVFRSIFQYFFPQNKLFLVTIGDDTHKLIAFGRVFFKLSVALISKQ